VNDDDLGAALHSLLAAVDPVPEAAMQAAYAAIGWRDLDSQLARLTSDTAGERELVHLRGQPPRLLTFRSGSTTIDLEISAQDGTVRLLGQLDPPVAATVAVQSAAGQETAVVADAHGRFSADGLPDERMRVIVDFTEDSRERAATEWFRA
jgi:hypothetical protein